MNRMGPVIAVLASGAARRFGGGKLQAKLGDKPLAAHAIQTALLLGQPVAIIGREDETPSWHDIFPSCEFVANPDASRGIGTSIRCAAHWAASCRASGMILLLADMPFVSERLIEKLSAAANAGERAACRYPDGGIGIPAAFPRVDFPLLARNGDDQGGKHLLRAENTLILRPPPRTLFDIDTRADLAVADEQLAHNHALEHS